MERKDLRNNKTRQVNTRLKTRIISKDGDSSIINYWRNLFINLNWLPPKFLFEDKLYITTDINKYENRLLDLELLTKINI